MTDTAGKPLLSDPMAEALAEDAAAAAAKAVQAAPVVDDTPAPAGTAAAPEGDTVEGAGASGDDTAAAPTDDTAKKKRTPIDVMASRIGAKTKEAADAKAEAAQVRAENEALKRLLEARGAAPDGDAPAPVTTPTTPSDARYTEAEVDARAEAKAQANAFNQRANETYEAGKEKFGDWDAKVQSLRDLGFMSNDLVDAAIASGAAADVIHHLGANVEEAERIAALTPVRMGVELGKLATKLGAPKSAKVSGAPAPITPVGGSVSPTVDFAKLAESNDMSAWVANRAKAGDPWAQGRRR